MSLQSNIRFHKKIAIIMVFLLSFQAGFPVAGWALTTGPSQPEFNSFEPIGTTEIVDLFSGDFVYNIPLFELPGPDGGYPFNLAYHSGVTMDQEASWVGLGWTLNSGAITRTMRGLPDDFNGTQVKRRTDMLPNKTWEFGIEGHTEFFGYKPKTESNAGSNGQLAVRLGFKTSHNNYKGWGAGLNLGLSSNNKNQDGFAFNGGLNMGFSSMDGASLQPSLSLAHTQDKLTNAFRLSSAINSREGLNNISLGYNRSITRDEQRGKGENQETVKNVTRNRGDLGVSYSFGRTAYSPQVGTSYRGRNFTGSLEAGGWTGANNLGGLVDVSFDKQELKNRNVWTSAKAHGFFHLRDRLDGEDFLLDFNREKEGPIRQNTPNLAAPITTPDIYNVVGQGIGGSYRAFRSDIGRLTDPHLTSNSGGGVVGIELGPGPGFDLGADLGGNWSSSKSQAWNTNLDNVLNFDNDKLDDDYEPYYFKAAGEHTAEGTDAYNYIGNEDAVRLKLKPDNNLDRLDLDDQNKLEKADGSTQSVVNKRAERKPRGNSFQPITNSELNAGGTAAMNEYQINYFEKNQLNSTGEPYLGAPYAGDASYLKDRHGVIERDIEGQEDQIAGMTALHPNGMRYVYALPVKNLVQREYSFSIEDTETDNCEKIKDIPPNSDGTLKYKHDNTDQYINVTEVPEFTHSHLLTAVLGADYVDYDDIPGPSDGDYGYWVKFNYAKTTDGTNPYQWKAPFYGANYLEGSSNDRSDGKGAFVYGEREQFYMATAESRSHLAVFDIQERADARGVSKEFQNINDDEGEASYLLHKIRLYSKLELMNQFAKPIKTVYFDYDYSLCPGVPNNDNTQTHVDHDNNSINNDGGKLTLKKVWFTYEDSNRGALSPYQFEYSPEDPDKNPAYDTHLYDRWGNYQDAMLGDDCMLLNHPYTNQGREMNSSDKLADVQSDAWHLTEVHLPSGATIDVEYESDDYAFVQDRTAMEMMKITGVQTHAGEIVPTNEDPLDDELKVYFDLGDDVRSFEYYVKDLHKVPVHVNGDIEEEYQIAYKILNSLNKSDGEKEYITGYAALQEIDGRPRGGIDNDGGFLYLKPVRLGRSGNLRNYHPFAAAAWQKLKLEFPDKLNDTDLDSYDQTSFRKAIAAMGGAIGELGSFFKNFYEKCSDDGFAKSIDLNNSFLRLNTPDGQKEGGGSRVKQVTLLDYWDIGEDNDSSNDTPTYGQVFEYTTEESFTDWSHVPRTRTISSGVAINEPSIGAEESALRYAKNWVQGAPMKTAENLFFEYPINESYYPGAGVGYSKVTVKSLATHLAMNPDPDLNLPSGFGTTGITVNEFYTAKDFPVLVEETPLESRVGFPRWVPYFVGATTNEKYAGTQGYAIILNDMHGKPHKVSHYGQDGAGNVSEDKISEIVYSYLMDDTKVYSSASNKRITKSLKNTVDVLVSDSNTNGSTDAVISQKELGVDYEFFTDMRESVSNSGSIHVGINVDFTTPIVFALSAWPKINLNFSKTRTAVTNKIIRKSGILLKTDAYDGQSHITTTNKVFDPMTGEPLLTSVNNSFDDPIYNYNLPARYVYDGMGEAYKNWGIQFDGTIDLDVDCGLYNLTNLDATIASQLVSGDECIVIDGCDNDPTLCDHKKFTYVGLRDGKYLFENGDRTEGLSEVDLTLMIVRSGRRNHLSAKAGSITALKDPTKGRTPESPQNPNEVNFRVPSSSTNSTAITRNLPITRVDSVLSSSAVVYQDNWDLDRGNCDTRTVTKTVNVGPSSGNCNCLIVMQNFNTIPQDCNPLYTLTYVVNGVTYTDSYNGNDGTVNAVDPVCSADQANNSCTNWNNWNCRKIACSLYPIENITVNMESTDPNNSDYCTTADNSWLPCAITVPGSINDCSGLSGTMEIDVTIPTEHFSLGQEGLWRPYQNYTYVTKRSPGTTGENTNYDLRTDGAFNAMPIFDWENPFFPQSNGAGKWKKTNEITKYGINGEEVENRDIIGLYSSALYGYNYNVPIAVASNAARHEIGFESFEEYDVSTLPDHSALTEGNIDFICNSDAKMTSQNYNIVGAYQEGGSYVWIDKAFYEGAPIPSLVEMMLKDENGNEYNLTAEATAMDQVNTASQGLNLPFKEDIVGVGLTSIESCGLPAGAYFTGVVNLKYCTNCDATRSLSLGTMEIRNNVAHTGKQSLAVMGSGTETIPQKTLQLIKGRKYVLSAWVHREGPQRYSFDNGAVKIGLESDGVLVDMMPQGNVIEGWQRIEAVATYNGLYQDLNLVIQTDASTSDIIYFDDFRIYPEDGSLQTYVYDPQDYRLQAVLDQNNYATFYHYDEEGNLFLVKKETAEGIKTIQETRGYVKSTP